LIKHNPEREMMPQMDALPWGSKVDKRFVGPGKTSFAG
jgi:hypothetical protein